MKNPEDPFRTNSETAIEIPEDYAGLPDRLKANGLNELAEFFETISAKRMIGLDRVLQASGINGNYFPVADSAQEKEVIACLQRIDALLDDDDQKIDPASSFRSETQKLHSLLG